MKVLIIDDEEHAIKALSIILNEYCEEIDLVGTASSALEGIKLINQTSPDLVFLDVEMPHGSGFDLLKGLDNRNFQTVFTTAYSNYAIEAFRINATNYLLKPIDIDELIRVVENIKSSLTLNKLKQNQDDLHFQKKELTKIPVSLKNEYLFIDLEDIQFIKSNGAYSEINVFDKKYTTAKNLKYYEGLLSSLNFLRVSNSYLINLDKVTKYKREDGGIVVLRNNSMIPVSRNRKRELKRLLGI